MCMPCLWKSSDHVVGALKQSSAAQAGGGRVVPQKDEVLLLAEATATSCIAQAEAFLVCDYIATTLDNHKVLGRK